MAKLEDFKVGMKVKHKSGFMGTVYEVRDHMIKLLITEGQHPTIFNKKTYASRYENVTIISEKEEVVETESDTFEVEIELTDGTIIRMDYKNFEKLNKLTNIIK